MTSVASWPVPVDGRPMLGVIGWPVDGSLSPVIHGAAFRALGLAWDYVRLPVAPGDLPDALGRLRDAFAGASVTMPHKTGTASLMDERSADAELLGAVNTIVVADGRLIGHNTDAPGFRRCLHEDLAFDAGGRSALVYGAGGAARACLLALARDEPAAITVAVRDRAKAVGLGRLLGGVADRLRVVGFDEVGAVRADLVVNATPLGGAGEELPLPQLGEGVVVVDLLYRPAVTPLVTAARAAGARAAGGLGLLLHQGAIAFEIWTGQPAPLDVMSAAAVAAASEHDGPRHGVPGDA